MNKLLKIAGAAFLTFILFEISVVPVFSQVLKVEGQFFSFNGKPFDMWGVRVASASQKEGYTQSLISNLDDFKSEGINTLSVFVQGSSGGYSDPFSENGKSIDSEHLRRLRKIIEECAKKDMVAIIGIFYQRTISNSEISQLNSEEEIRNAVKTITRKLKPYRNVIINIANEQNSFQYKSFKAFNFNEPQNIIELCKLVKDVDPERIVGGGGYNDSLNVILGKSAFTDVLLFDTFSGDIEKGHDSGWHYDYFKRHGVPDKPIVNVEIFGGWTGQFTPQGVYSPEGKQVHLKEIEAAKKQPGLYVHFHSNPWFQGVGQNLSNRYDLGGMGTSGNPGVRWYFKEINP